MFPHLMAREVAAFVRGRVGGTRGLWLALHLIACPECSDLFQRRYRSEGDARLSEVLGMEKPESGWPTEIARCTLDIAENDPGWLLWESLRSLPRGERSLRLRNLPQSQRTPGLVMALLKESRELWHESARESGELAVLAVQVSLRLLADRYPWPSLLYDLMAEGLAHMGNSQRIQGQLRYAEPKLRGALFVLVFGGSGDVRLFAQFLWLYAKLQRDAEDYPLARNLYDVAEACFKAVDDPQWLGILQLDKANLLAEEGNLAASTQKLQRLVNGGLFSTMPFLAQLSATQSLAADLCRLGRFFEARKLLPEVERLVAVVGGALNHLKVKWLKARVAVGTRRWRTAEILYREVRDRWIALEHSMDAALVTLELAELYLARGRPEEAKEQALVVLEVCRSLQGMRREELEAIATLARAEEGRVEKALVSLRSLLETTRSPARKRAPG